MTQANNSSNDRFCFNCHKTLHTDDIHDNFCSWSCFDKYRLDREKWERLKQEKEKENGRAN
jgi:hypothetical protein